MTEAPPERRGQPAPLLFHLGAALATYQAGLMAAPALGRQDFPWHPDIAAPEATSPDLIALTEEIVARLGRIDAGLHRWRAAPRQIDKHPAPVLWQAGSTRLLDHRPPDRLPGRPVLVVPSLINRATILDLHPQASFLRQLAAAGLDPVLLDWGRPERAEAAFDLDRYVTARLLPAAAFLQGVTGQPPALLGYCMGGTLAAAYAAVVPGVPRLVTIGAPWSFASGAGMAGALRQGARAQGVAQVERILASQAAVFGFVPGELFQQLFALIDPLQVTRKFPRFADDRLTGTAAEIFVALEDWLADPVPMAGPAAIDLLVRWQVEDRLASGRWSCLGRPVIARDIPCPTLVVTGRRDTIAGLETARSLTEDIPNATPLITELGHVGMIVSRAAHSSVVRPVVDFLKTLD